MPQMNLPFLFPLLLLAAISVVNIQSFTTAGSFVHRHSSIQHRSWKIRSTALFQSHDTDSNAFTAGMNRLMHCCTGSSKTTTKITSTKNYENEIVHTITHNKLTHIGLNIAIGTSIFLSMIGYTSPSFAVQVAAVQEQQATTSISTTATTTGTAANTITTRTVATVAAIDKQYDGFAEYAKENQMDQSDVSCFMNQCGTQTKALFQNPRGIKGVVCLGQCKGEQACATRCFAQYGSDTLNDWLSCTIEENECVKVPKTTKIINNSAENVGYSTTVKKFNPSTLIGTWYKTDGLNPNYDLFDCQTNTFDTVPNTKNELEMGIFFRVQRPEGGYWENTLTEHMVVDSSVNGDDDTSTKVSTIDDNDMNPTGRTMHTSGKMYGLQFSENWYILGESDGTGSIPPFKLVAYKGHTLQGNYEGAFVYAKESVLPPAAIPAVSEAAKRAGLNLNDFTRIDNTCPAGTALNDDQAGTGTSTKDWINLVIGEGGVIDWITPGWRGEYKK